MSLYIFDMGEVLLLGVNTLRDIASAYGLDYKEFRVDYALYDKPLMEGYLHPRSYLEHLETKFDLSFDSDPFQVYFTPKLNERVMGFVRTLRERGDRVVVGSNTFSPHWEIVFSRYKEIPLSFLIHHMARIDQPMNLQIDRLSPCSPQILRPGDPIGPRPGKVHIISVLVSEEIRRPDLLPIKFLHCVVLQRPMLKIAGAVYGKPGIVGAAGKSQVKGVALPEDGASRFPSAGSLQG